MGQSVKRWNVASKVRQQYYSFLAHLTEFMLDFQEVRRQLNDFNVYQAQFRKERETHLKNALNVFQSLNQEAKQWLVPAPDETVDKLIASPIEEDPGRFTPVEERPTPITVVATDGSQIYPDRNIEPLCYLLNVSRIAFQYGTQEPPRLEAVPTLCFRGQALEGLDEELLEITGRDIVSAFRDELELSELLSVALEARIDGRPLIALADGTLIRWMLRRIQNPELESILLNRFTRVLASFREQNIPICSYISMPANKEFTRLLMHQVYDDPKEREKSLLEIDDRIFFEQVLPLDARTAVFKSRSKVLSGYAEDLQVCFFYVHIGFGESVREIARVEFPLWMMQNETWIHWVHATVVSEARKGRGYPMILSEAHEHAVVRNHERSLFYELIEQESAFSGKTQTRSMKKASKERAVL